MQIFWNVHTVECRVFTAFYISFFSRLSINYSNVFYTKKISQISEFNKAKNYKFYHIFSKQKITNYGFA